MQIKRNIPADEKEREREKKNIKHKNGQNKMNSNGK